MKECISPGEDREHTIYRYTDQIYKIVQFYSVRLRLGPGPKEAQTHHDEKLDSSISRARRVILEKALCNKWDWFCTLTISADKADRQDLSSWWPRVSQWFRDLRKKGYEIKYLIVPERHADGSWHAHGLLSGIPVSSLVTFHDLDLRGYRSSNGKRLPKDLRESGYYNWPEYQEKFGFCSLGSIEDAVACGFYMAKYITKDQSRMVSDVGLHAYYVTQNLNVATKHLDFYGRDPFVDTLLVNKYDFCATGMTHVKHDLDWTFGLDFSNFTSLFDSSESSNEAEACADAYFEFEQMCMSSMFG